MAGKHGNDRPRNRGRSGNDFLAGSGDGYESWAAEGPSGTVGSGGYEEDDTRGFATKARSWRAKRESGDETESSGGGLFAVLVAAGIGAALMYFLDGERGAERRQQATEKVRDVMKSGTRAAQGAASGVRERFASERSTSDVGATDARTDGDAGRSTTF